MNEKLRIGPGRKQDLAIASIFGKLKSNIDFSFVEEKQRTILFTSALPNEGKTTIAVNIAAAMAASDQKTILLDSDMRNPSTHLLFNLVNTRGLSDIISQNGDWRQFIYKTKIPNLYLITAGRKPSNPSRFLSSERFRGLLAELTAEFDYVVLDTPPVLLVPDTQIISPHVDGVVLVVKNGKTSRESVKDAFETLQRANANVIGAVLNHAGKKEHVYGYGYGYGVDSKTANRVPARVHRTALEKSPAADEKVTQTPAKSGDLPKPPGTTGTIKSPASAGRPASSARTPKEP